MNKQPPSTNWHTNMVDHVKPDKALKGILDTKEQSYHGFLVAVFLGWALLARSMQRHDSFKKRLPDSAVVAKTAWLL